MARYCLESKLRRLQLAALLFIALLGIGVLTTFRGPVWKRPITVHVYFFSLLVAWFHVNWDAEFWRTLEWSVVIFKMYALAYKSLVFCGWTVMALFCLWREEPELISTPMTTFIGTLVLGWLLCLFQTNKC
jgi:hypothetical protein